MRGLLAISLISVGLVAGQNQNPGGQTQNDEDFHVYRDAPRLLLTPQRLRLLQRERERQSPRWEQFDSLMSAGAAMAEPGFAWALYYQVSRQANAAKQAIDWALSDAPGSLDLRQLALVFDWCGPALTPAQSDRLAAKIQAALAKPANTSINDVRGQSARVFATIALADRLPDQGNAILSEIVQKWWRAQVVPQLASRGNAPPAALPREQRYALYEMLHALRDNVKVDLRESAPGYFKGLPLAHLTGHYPAPFAAPENEFLIPVYLHDGNPDPADAAMSRAAALAMVAYDANALESQLLQGWLMRDRFLMRGSLGAVYEFLWANPYQPGLNYDHVDLVFHDPYSGEVFARTTWDEDATWIGYFDGRLQLFQNGRLQTLRQGAAVSPVQIGTATVASAPAQDTAKFHLENQTLFVLGLAPRSEYAVEIDDQELELLDTDAAGTLQVPTSGSADVGVRIRLRGPSPDAIK